MSTPPNAYRSPVPDLLFEDVLADRLRDIEPYLEAPEAVQGDTPLHRVTVFLTYHCNLDCPYCKTIARTDDELRLFPQKSVTFTPEMFEQLLRSLDGTPLHHLHFTGGEAALVRGFPGFVRQAKAQGVAHISLTSNGTLPWPVYAALLDSGLDELRISIDARDPQLGRELTGRQRAWPAAVENLRRLADQRAAGRNFFLIANTVVSARNRTDLPAIVRFLMEMGVDDIKLIMVVQERETLGDFPEALMIMRELEALLATQPPEAFPLLRRKLRTVFVPEAIGLSAARAPAGKAWQCYIPLTERTVDGVYYYPCSVYLREGGAPLGNIDESPATQRAKTAAFVRHGQCLSDPICQHYCLNCTGQYNTVANAQR